MAQPFNIDQFRTNLVNGGVRPNQFVTYITFPAIVQQVIPEGTLLQSRGAYLTTVAELPGQTLGVTPVFYRGRELKLAGDKTFAPFTCTILNDNDFTLRKGLEQWMQYIESNTNKVGLSNPASYQSDITVQQLDRTGTALRSYIMKYAFPVDLSAINLDFGANDQISNFQVAFQYQHFEVITGDSNAGGLNESQTLQVAQG
jgi:hypothetical protein